MRPPLASWMTPVDRDILEKLANGDEDELALTPALISVNTDWGHQTIREHVSVLRDHGLIEYYDQERGIYQISNLGRKYLRGEVDPSDLKN
ncbi:ArsR family transcriptional regulator [Halorubrum sp. PV6]|nr:ArsR family transcriptional regulator [Halorubrum sp. PV6]